MTSITVSEKGPTYQAARWFKNGDFPYDGPNTYEGAEVRYFRSPEISGKSVCKDCGRTMHDHGWVDQPGAEFIVCPGDWITFSAPRSGNQKVHIFGVYHPDVFEFMFEKVPTSVLIKKWFVGVRNSFMWAARKRLVGGQ